MDRASVRKIPEARSLHEPSKSHHSHSRTIRVNASSRKTSDIAGRETHDSGVYERAKLAKRADRVIVATDDERIINTVQGFGGEARMTRSEHRTGTERVAEVARAEQGDVFVNVQGDEPLVDPNSIDIAVHALLEEPQASISTVATPIKTPGISWIQMW